MSTQSFYRPASAFSALGNISALAKEAQVARRRSIASSNRASAGPSTWDNIVMGAQKAVDPIRQAHARWYKNTGDQVQKTTHGVAGGLGGIIGENNSLSAGIRGFGDAVQQNRADRAYATAPEINPANRVKIPASNYAQGAGPYSPGPAPAPAAPTPPPPAAPAAPTPPPPAAPAAPTPPPPAAPAAPAGPTPEQLAQFQQGTRSQFDPNSWLDRNKMNALIQGQQSWADNAAARAAGRGQQYAWAKSASVVGLLPRPEGLEKPAFAGLARGGLSHLARWLSRSAQGSRNKVFVDAAREAGRKIHAKPPTWGTRGPRGGAKKPTLTARERHIKNVAQMRRAGNEAVAGTSVGGTRDAAAGLFGRLAGKVGDPRNAKIIDATGAAGLGAAGLYGVYSLGQNSAPTPDPYQASPYNRYGYLS
jgi:hypothetical protein